MQYQQKPQPSFARKPHRFPPVKFQHFIASSLRDHPVNEFSENACPYCADAESGVCLKHACKASLENRSTNVLRYPVQVRDFSYVLASTYEVARFTGQWDGWLIHGDGKFIFVAVYKGRLFTFDLRREENAVIRENLLRVLLFRRQYYMMPRNTWKQQSMFDVLMFHALL